MLIVKIFEEVRLYVLYLLEHYLSKTLVFGVLFRLNKNVKSNIDVSLIQFL